jgi:hypothetical protein
VGAHQARHRHGAGDCLLFPLVVGLTVSIWIYTRRERAHTRDPQAQTRPSPPWWPMFPAVVIAVVILFLVSPSALTRVQTAAELSESQRALDDAAKQRARQFVYDLGFSPGGVVCRAERSGSAWCTIRVEATDTTFALFCSWKHPSCIENRAEIDPN